MTQSPKPCLIPDEANAYLASAFDGPDFDRPLITRMEDGFAEVTLETGVQHLRPGNIISGPTQMALTDTVAYICIFTKIGITPMAVTSHLGINFLRPCHGPIIRAEARCLKIGRTLAVLDVRIFGGDEKLAAQASVTYALPKPA